MKILIAEDDPMLQRMAGTIMNHWGFDFDIASNGLEAVEHAQLYDGEYDLCLMDIDMPVMNGLEATKIIRRKLNYFPIIALTGNTSVKDESFEIGMDDFLGKPYRIQDLHTKINELVIKTYEFKITSDDLSIKKGMPMDQQHAQELRELKKQNLIKVKFDEISGAEVVVHKNIINKIVQDFNIKKQFISTFLNRNPEKPTKCVLLGNNCRMPQIYLENTDYEKELQAENEEVEKYPEMILKVE